MNLVDKKITDPCVLCNQSIKTKAEGFWETGNNAEPLASGQCCDICNHAVVLARWQITCKRYFK